MILNLGMSLLLSEHRTASDYVIVIWAKNQV